ncbi:MAG: signal peptide peptidase SppA [Bryobacteraceae bacterium]|nr:signal peptide peptidase SppA [Bryobacteraceae bacterium]
MRKFIGRVLAWIGGITVALFLLVFLVATFARAGKGKVPGNTILEVNLETSLAEDAPDDPFAKLRGMDRPTVRDIVESLDKAGSDSRVRGLIARTGSAPMSLAQVQEIRDAISAFRAKKKFAVAFAETFGEFGQGNGAYYLASAFDEIWLQPSGDVGLHGLMMQPMFLRGTFDKFGIVPRFDQRYEYKNAMNTYTDRKMTPPFREAMQKILDSSYTQLVRGIAAGRQLTEEQVKSAIDNGPHYGKEALDRKLVDGLAYRDEVYAKVKQKAGAGAEFLWLNRYLDRAGRPNQKGPTVALIYGVGAVQRGKSDYDPFSDSGSMGSDTVTAAFRQAIQDEKVKAILFRVDSPGGSYVASDAIWRETMRARKAGKPLIVSMSSVAGSGGYFVAMAADKIVAQPGTITGSIGVLGGKFLLNGLFDKVGVTFDEVHAGKNARMMSTVHDFSPEEWQRFQHWLDRVYSDFTTKVAEGRRLPKEKVLQLAKGRIWSGEDARQLGLVDEVGGYPVALKLVKQSLKLKDTDEIDLRVYPKKKTAVEALMARMGGEERDSSESAQAAALLLRTVESVRPAIETLRQMGIIGANRDVLTMPELAPIR